MAPKRFVSWVAVSSRPQIDGGSPTDQRERNLAHIEKWGGVLVADLEVPGQSRSYITLEDARANIDAYRHLERLISEHAFDVLICYNVGRLGRKRSLITTVIDLCYEAGIMVYRTSSPPHSLEFTRKGYSDLLIEAIESATFQNEVDQMVENNKTGMIRRVERGWMPSNIPFGWVATYQNRREYTLVIDEQAAKAIRLAFDLYCSGMGMYSIAIELNRLGFKSYGKPRKNQDERERKPFQMDTIKAMLGRVWIYAGYAEVNRISATREHVRVKSSRIPPIIDEVVLQRVVAELALRKRANPPKGKHLYSGIVLCTKCNVRMTVTASGGARIRKSGKRWVSPNVKCPHCRRQLSFLAIEKALLSWFESIADQSLPPEQPDIDNTGIEQERQSLQRQFDAIPQAQERAYNAFVDGDVSRNVYQAQMKRLEARKRELQDSIKTIDLQLAKHRRSEEQVRRWSTVKEVGGEMIAMGKDRPELVNAWLREYIRVRFDENRKVTVFLS